MKSKIRSFMRYIHIAVAVILAFGIYSPAFAADIDLTITKVHSGDFAQGSTGNTYTITVTNIGTLDTDGTLITVTDTLPAGLTASAISSTDLAWTCTTSPVLGCTRTTPLVPNFDSVITLTVSVAGNAPASVTNEVTVSGGGDVDPENKSTDVTTIVQRADLIITGYEIRNAANNAVITNPQAKEPFWIRLFVKNQGSADTGLIYPGVFLDAAPNFGPDHDAPPMNLGDITSFSEYRIAPEGSLNYPQGGCLYYDPLGTIDPLTQEINPERGNYTRSAYNNALPPGASIPIDVQIAYPASEPEYSTGDKGTLYDIIRTGLDEGVYQVTLYVDPNCSAGDTESSENNNSYGPISITVGTPPIGGAANGTAIITSSQALVGTGRLHMDGQVTAYNSDNVGNLNVSVPMLFKNQFGGSYDSALYVQNTSTTTAANITINYYDVYGAFTCAVNDSILALSSKSYWLPNVSCLPDPWSGGVNITSSQPISAVGRSHIGTEVTSYNDFAAGSTTMYIPMLFKHQFGGAYDSALYVQNMSPTDPAHINIKFYDVYGNYSGEMPATLTPLSATGFWIPLREFLPDPWSGGAVVTSDQPIVAIGRPHINEQVTAYNGFASGSNTVNIPMLFKNKPGPDGTYSSAIYVQNVDPLNSATINTSFYDDDGTYRGSLDTLILPSYASTGFWLPLRDFLPEGWSGSAILTSNHPIVALGRLHVDNEIMTYNGSAGGTSFYVPMLFKDDFNGTNYDSALVLQNTQNSTANVNVKYYSKTGALACIYSRIIAPYASFSFWSQGLECP